MSTRTLTADPLVLLRFDTLMAGRRRQMEPYGSPPNAGRQWLETDEVVRMIATSASSLIVTGLA